MIIRSCAAARARVLSLGLILCGCVSDEESKITGSAPISESDDAGGMPSLEDAGAGAMDDDAAKSADAAAQPPADAGMALGEPIDAPDGVWTWIDFPDSFCRDGSTTGIAVSLKSESPDVVIYLEGGGACFDALSCAANSGNVQSQKGEKNRGIFDRSEPENPVRDWNIVYVPYCTGDVHAGTRPNATVPAFPGTQMFVGHLNIQAFLKRIVPTFPDAERVLLTGISAGAFGASINTLLVPRAFANVDVMLLNDSGPPLSSEYLSPCLQQKWRDLWGLDVSMLADCGSDCPNRDDFVFDFARHAASVYADRPSGFIEATEDGTISGFFGAGEYGCLTVPFVTPVPADRFREGVINFRDAMRVWPKFSSYLPSGTQHTWIAGDSLYTSSIGDTRLVDWLRSLVDGDVALHIGPPVP